MFKINQFCFDSQNKEFVKITNGIPVNEGCHECGITPTEGLALRIVSLDNGVPVIAYTYRKVDPTFLSDAKDGGQFEAILSTEKPKHYTFIGRV